MLRAAAHYFVGVFAAGFVLGILRTLALDAVPGLTALTAVALELPLILGYSAWWALRVLRREPPRSRPGWLAVGLIALLLLLIAEALLSLGLAGRTLSEHLALYAATPYQLGLAGQVVYALLPCWLSGRIRHQHRL